MHQETQVQARTEALVLFIVDNLRPLAPRDAEPEDKEPTGADDRRTRVLGYCAVQEQV